MKIEMFNSAFWGIILILIGALLIIKYVFDIQIPIGRIVIAVVLIYLGIRLLIGHQEHYWGMNIDTDNSAVFSDQQFTYSPERNNYNCAFGSCTLDLSNISITENKTIFVSVAFGEFRMKVNKDANFEIHSSTAFGSTQANDYSSNGFGQRTYYSPNFKSELPHLTIKTNAAFGSMKIIYK